MISFKELMTQCDAIDSLSQNEAVSEKVIAIREGLETLHRRYEALQDQHDLLSNCKESLEAQVMSLAQDQTITMIYWENSTLTFDDDPPPQSAA